MDPVLAIFRPLTLSQRKVGKYFLIVAAVLLLQILVGSIMAHYYADRASFYGVRIDSFLPFNFLRDVHIQTPIVWLGPHDRAPAHQRRDRPPVDLCPHSLE
jgi:nitric oxide reductase subunit B